MKEIDKMSYTEFMAFLGEENRPPGGREQIIKLAEKTFINSSSNVLHIGCSTGFSTREIVHLTHSKATGVDIDPAMIKVAKRITSNDSYESSIDFLVGDVMGLMEEDEKFDLVFSAGSIAFVQDKNRAISEMVRVCRPWGFVADMVMFYHDKPSAELLQSLYEIMKIKILPWDKKYWFNLYKQDEKLELFYEDITTIPIRSRTEIDKYCRSMTSFITDDEIKKRAHIRLKNIMEVFNENQNLLSTGLLIFRKREYPAQAELFLK